jgi:hypothetical protein
MGGGKGGGGGQIRGVDGVAIGRSMGSREWAFPAL